MESTEEKAKQIFGSRASMYTTSAAHADAGVLARIVELARPQPEWNALDIATGSGHTAIAISRHVKLVAATDLTREMIGEAKRLCEAQAVSNLEFCLADAHRLPFPGNSFDLVTCRRAAHHFSNITGALDEMKRLLKPGARLVIDDRSVPEDDFVDGCMNALDRYHDNSHVRQYRPSEWKPMLEAVGFEVDDVEPYEKHRPLTSLTDRVPPADLRMIEETLSRLSPRERALLRLMDVGGEPYINHWYVMIAARRADKIKPA